MAYLNVVEIESALQALADAYPATAELIATPNPSHGGRVSHVLRVGSAGAGEAPGVLVLGGMHAREWVPPDALVSLAADLLEAHKLGTGLGYGNTSFSAVDVARVLDEVNLFFYACVNPDGRHFSQTSDALWRKNRRPHPNGGDCIGVDLNRNFDFLWNHTTKFAPDSGVSASANPCDRNVYRGPSAHSEPESRNVVAILDTHKQIRWLMDVHSAVPVILHNWGSDENQSSQPAQTFLNPAFDGLRGRAGDAAYGEYITQDDLHLVETLSRRMNDAIKAVRGDDYGFEQAFGLYPTSGASDDYASSRHFADASKSRAYGFCVECGHSFQPTWSEAEHVIREVSAGLIAFCLEASSSGAEGSVSGSVQGGDIALVRQTAGWGSIPLAMSVGDGTWKITNGSASPDFVASWANQPGVRVVSGDFNGNGLSDIALVRQTPGWGSIPVAFAQGDGTWKITNGTAPQFISDWSHQPDVRVVSGDFNGNGLTDLALVRQSPGWGSIPIAFAQGDGSWKITNGTTPQFITDWSHQPGVRVIAGDFNGNGLTDLALVRQTPGWGSIPIAFAQGDGSWKITNGTAPQFITDWSHQPGVRVIAGDFNGNGLTDLALIRQTPGWGSIPIAFAQGDGTWKITNGPAPQFITDWSHQPGVRLVAGDYNGNGITDIALVRQTPGWASIPVAFANGDGTWKITNGPAPQFITDWSHQPGVRLVSGDYNGNGITDIALVRQTPGWASIPVAFANGNGTWKITNGPAPQFITDWSHQPAVRAIPGDYR